VPATQEDLTAALERLGIAAPVVSHPPLFTVEQSQALRGKVPGAHTKNLFLKDKKSRLFLVTVLEDAEIDLKQLHHVIGASGRLSFGSPELLMERLGVIPGAVTPLGVLNDQPATVTVVLDAALVANELINCHPLVNTATITLARADLLAFLNATGHEPLILAVDQRAAGGQL
jgi:Ala-tRNA(Pro) deacylase